MLNTQQRTWILKLQSWEENLAALCIWLGASTQHSYYSRTIGARGLASLLARRHSSSPLRQLASQHRSEILIVCTRCVVVMSIEKWHTADNGMLQFSVGLTQPRLNWPANLGKTIRLTIVSVCRESICMPEMLHCSSLISTRLLIFQSVWRNSASSECIWYRWSDSTSLSIAL